MFLEKFLVVLFGHLAVAPVEPSPVILLNGNHVLFRAARGYERSSDWTRAKSPVRLLLNILSLSPILFPSFFEYPAAAGG